MGLPKSHILQELLQTHHEQTVSRAIQMLKTLRNPQILHSRELSKRRCCLFLLKRSYIWNVGPARHQGCWRSLRCTLSRKKQTWQTNLGCVIRYKKRSHFFSFRRVQSLQILFLWCHYNVPRLSRVQSLPHDALTSLFPKLPGYEPEPG